jgi:hypothetical protein
MPHVGDKVIPEGTDSTWVVTQISPGGEEVRLGFEGTNLDLRFQLRSSQSYAPAQADRATGRARSPAQVPNHRYQSSLCTLFRVIGESETL